MYIFLNDFIFKWYNLLKVFFDHCVMQTRRTLLIKKKYPISYDNFVELF